MARKSDTKEIKKKHSSRPVGGAEKGSLGGEDSSCRGGTKSGVDEAKNQINDLDRKEERNNNQNNKKKRESNKRRIN